MGNTQSSTIRVTSPIADIRSWAEWGDPIGQCLLGLRYWSSSAYRNLEGVKSDDREAEKWFRKAAEQGDAAAQVFLGDMYEDGMGGLACDTEQAIYWYRKAANQGDSLGKLTLAKALLQRGPPYKGKPHAEYEFCLIENKPKNNEQLTENKIYFEKTQEGGLKYIKKLFDGSIAEKTIKKQDLCDNYLSKIIAEPLTVDILTAEKEQLFKLISERHKKTSYDASIEDSDEAAKLLLSVANTSDAVSSEAKIWLGYLALPFAIVPYDKVYPLLRYYRSRCITKDIKKAFEWWLQSAKEGNENAQYLVGFFYMYGEENVKRDDKEAERWLISSAEAGCQLGMYQLGQFYNRERDYHKAYTWLLKAEEPASADRSICYYHHEAKLLVASLYIAGRGVTKNYKKAFKRVEAVLNTKSKWATSPYHDKAAALMGLMHQYGFGTSRNAQEAIKWYKKALGVHTPYGSINFEHNSCAITGFFFGSLYSYFEAHLYNHVPCEFETFTSIIDTFLKFFFKVLSSHTLEVPLYKFEEYQAMALHFMRGGLLLLDIWSKAQLKPLGNDTYTTHIPYMDKLAPHYGENRPIITDITKEAMAKEFKERPLPLRGGFNLNLPKTLEELTGFVIEIVEKEFHIETIPDKIPPFVSLLGLITGACLIRINLLNYSILDDAAVIQWCKSAEVTLKLCYEQMIIHLEQIANEGIIWAQATLALCYKTGNTVSQDNQKAIEWFKKASEQPTAGSDKQSKYGSYKRRDITHPISGLLKMTIPEILDYKKAYSIFKSALELTEVTFGEPSALCYMGLLYEYGLGSSRCLKLAVDFYKRSVEQPDFAPNPLAPIVLAVCYARGLAGVVSEAEIEALFCRAKSPYLIFDIFYPTEANFYPFNPDPVPALLMLFFEMLAAREEIGALVVLGAIYERGLLFQQQDLQKALSYYRKAAALGDAYAKRCCDRAEAKEQDKSDEILSACKEKESSVVTEVKEIKVKFSQEKDSDILQENLRISSENIKYGQLIGRGSSSEVFSAHWMHRRVAIKKYIAQLNMDIEKIFHREINVLYELRHPNIVALYGVLVEPDTGLVLEFMAEGTLYNLLHSDKPLSWQMRYSMGLGIASGLLYLHQNNFVHRDLRSANVLLDEKYEAKLADFGLTRIPGTVSGVTAGVVEWVAPELLFASRGEAKCTMAADIFSFAIILWELMSRQHPYREGYAHLGQIMNAIFQQKREEIPEQAPEILKKLTVECWAHNAESRPSAIKVVEMLDKNPVTDTTPIPSSHFFKSVSTNLAPHSKNTDSSSIASPKK